ncbi:hypothetical protein FIM04_01295 [SAR202 cluster bacterium AC-409-J13_OGT_754m]|nr:hypothetical protein [SAR202 cluster bacterium AC-409-J13_OGT_754m]
MRKLIIYACVMFMLLIVGQGGFSFSQTESMSNNYRWSLLKWEVANLPDKWVYKVKQLVPWYNITFSDKDDLQRFFDVSTEISRVKALNVGGIADRGIVSATGMADTERLDEMISLQTRLKPRIEESLETHVSEALEKEGLESNLGILWPPVDVALERPPSLLVISPRNIIRRQQSLLLRPNIIISQRDKLEKRITSEENLSALVIDIGGIATYPSIVAPTHGLRESLVIIVHEWLHQYWFFKPLGRNYWLDDNTTILNESAADMIADEMGGHIFRNIVGLDVDVSDHESDITDQSGFVFPDEMRATRLEVEQLLKQGRVQDAELYMEQRRRLFVDQGYQIRKLNQAYFAFHGTYAGTPASISPIKEELQFFRSSTYDIGDFVRQLAQFSNYAEFKEHIVMMSNYENAEEVGD